MTEPCLSEGLIAGNYDQSCGGPEIGMKSIQAAAICCRVNLTWRYCMRNWIVTVRCMGTALPSRLAG